MARITANVAWSDNTADLARNVASGLDQIEVNTKRVNKLVNDFGSGAIRQAHEFATAVDKIGGASALTEAQQKRVNDIVEKALEKYRLLGQEAPRALTSLADATQKVEHETNALSGWFRDLATHIGETAAGFVTAEAIIEGFKEVVHLAAETLKEITIEGSHAADIEQAFDHLTKGAGLLGEHVLPILRDGVRGTVTDLDLMTRVNSNLAAGLNLSEAQMATLAKGAFALAKATGGDTKTAFDELSDAMVTGRTRSIALLTGKIDLVEVEKKFAAALGTTADHLNAEGKLEAVREAILERVGSATDRVGEQTVRLADKIAQAQVAAKNFGEELGTAIAVSPVIAAGMDGIRDAIVGAFGDKQTEAIHAVADAIDDASIAIVDFAKTATLSAGFVIKEWLAAEKLFLDVAQAIDDVRLGIALIERGPTLWAPPPDSKYFAQYQQATKEINGLFDTIARRKKELDSLTAGQQNIDLGVTGIDAALDKIVDRMRQAKRVTLAVDLAVDSHSVDVLASTVSRLSASGDLPTATMKRLGSAAKELQDTGVTLPPVLEAVVTAMDRLEGSTNRATVAGQRHNKYTQESEAELKANKAALEEYQSAGQNYFDVITKIGTATYEGIKFDHERSISTETLARIYGVTKTQIEQVVKAEEQWKKAAEETSKLHQKQVDQFLAANIEIKAALQKRADVLDKWLADAFTAQKSYEEKTLALNESGLDGQLAAIERQRRDAVALLGDAPKGFEEQWRRSIDAVNHYFDTVRDHALYAADSIEAVFAKASAEADRVPPHIRKISDEAALMAEVFSRLGQTIGGAFGAALVGAGELSNVIGHYRQAVQDFGSGSTQARDARQTMIAASIGVGASLVSQNINTGAGASTGNVVAAGALQGAAAGAAIGAPYAAATFGISVGAGAVAGAIVGWIQSGKEWRKVVNDTARDFGNLHVSEDFAKSIDDLESQTGLGRMAALTTQLDQLVQIAGGLNDQNITMFTGKLRDAFVMLGRHELTLQQTTQILDKNFADFAAHATDKYGRLADNVRELISLNDQYGTKSKAIADYLASQSTNALGALPSIVGGIDSNRLDTIKGTFDSAAIDAVAATDQVINQMTASERAALSTGYADAVKQGFKGTIEEYLLQQDHLYRIAQAGNTQLKTALSSDTFARLDALDAIQKYNNALTDQESAAIETKDKLDDLGIVALATFKAATDAGMPFLEALAKAHEGIDRLTKDYEALGLAIDNPALKQLTAIDKILNSDAGKRAAGSLAGLGTGAVALDNIGKLDADAFGAMERTGVHNTQDLFNAGINAGATADEALRTALLGSQDWLHIAEDEAKKRGLELDAQTATEIQQSKDLGLWKEEELSATQKADEQLKALADAAKAASDALNGLAGLPPAPETPPGGLPQTPSTPGSHPSPSTPAPPDTPVIQEASGGSGYISTPTLFYSGGKEDFWFSGEGQTRSSFVAPSVVDQATFEDVNAGATLRRVRTDTPMDLNLDITVVMGDQVIGTVTRRVIWPELKGMLRRNGDGSKRDLQTVLEIK